MGLDDRRQATGRDSGECPKTITYIFLVYACICVNEDIFYSLVLLPKDMFAYFRELFGLSLSVSHFADEFLISITLHLLTFHIIFKVTNKKNVPGS